MASAPELASALLPRAREHGATAQQAILEAALNGIPSGVLVFDGNRLLVFANAAAKNSLGSMELIPGNSLDNLLSAFRLFDPESGRYVPLDKTPLSRALRGETVEGVEYRSATRAAEVPNG